MAANLTGRRVVVVGASAGIGRAFGIAAVQAGGDVVLAARRTESLDAAVADAGGGEALALDVCDPASRSRFFDALQAGPAVDLLLVTVGTAAHGPLAAADEAAWSATLTTNVVGVSRVVEEAIPVLAAEGVVAVASSESRARPRRDLIPYAASKAALETVLVGSRIEHLGLRVSCIVLGGTMPTDFGTAFDVDRVSESMADWKRHGIMQTDYMTTDDVAAVLVQVYAAALAHPGVNVDEITLRSPSPVIGTR